MDGSQLGFCANHFGCTVSGRSIFKDLVHFFFVLIQKGLSCWLLFDLLYMLRKAVCPLEYVVTGVLNH